MPISEAEKKYFYSSPAAKKITFFAASLSEGQTITFTPKNG